MDPRLLRRGSRTSTDRLPTSREVWGRGSSGNFLILTPQSPLSWVSESFRQDIYLLSKSLCRFNLESLKLFTKNIFIMKNLTNFCKTVRPVWIRAWKLTEYSRSSRGQLLCIY